jgi:hypothetical protein
MISDPVIEVADQDAGGAVVPPDVAAPAKPKAPKCQLSAADPGLRSLRCCPRNRSRFPHHNHGVQLRELSISLLLPSSAFRASSHHPHALSLPTGPYSGSNRLSSLALEFLSFSFVQVQLLLQLFVLPRQRLRPAHCGTVDTYDDSPNSTSH